MRYESYVTTVRGSRKFFWRAWGKATLIKFENGRPEGTKIFGELQMHPLVSVNL